MLRRSARFRHSFKLFWAARVEACFWVLSLKPLFFLVVSGAPTELALAHVPETTIKIVVSGTRGEKEKSAEPKKGGKSRMKACFGVLCLKPLFLQWFQVRTLGWFLLMSLKPL